MKELALHIMDIAQNSLAARATRVAIHVEDSPPHNRLRIAIRDNGSGMTPELLRRVTDPFTTSRTTRRVGMGLPLLHDACRMAGGQLHIESQLGVGTTVTASFARNHLDLQPMGDVAGVIALLVSANPAAEFLYTHTTPRGEYTFDTREVKQVLDGIPVSSPQVVGLIRAMIENNLEELQIEQPPHKT